MWPFSLIHSESARYMLSPHLVDHVQNKEKFFFVLANADSFSHKHF